MVRHLHLELVGQRAVLDDTCGQLVGLGGVQQVLDNRVERLLNNQVALLLYHVKVFEQTISEEVVNDVEAVLVSIVGVIGGNARA